MDLDYYTTQRYKEIIPLISITMDQKYLKLFDIRNLRIYSVHISIQTKTHFHCGLAHIMKFVFVVFNAISIQLFMNTMKGFMSKSTGFG
jgi:hypothetical protein